jgi:hypothetical protein
MRNLLALVGLAVVGFGVLGWYMGWYQLSYSHNSEGNLQIKTDVDTKKVGDDTSTFFKNAAATVGSHIEKNAKDAKQPPAPPGNTPGPIGAQQPTDPPAPEKPAVPQTPPERTPIRLVPPK